MEHRKFFILMILILLFSGCLDKIQSGFQQVQVVYVNVNVTSQDNGTVIQNITAKGGEVSKIKAPGAVLPEKFPAIYAEILQEYNLSKPGTITLTTISLSNGLDYTGPGNYSFMVQLLENTLNKSKPIYVYSEITTNKTRLARAEIEANWTE
jgi:hypothetical protein